MPARRIVGERGVLLEFPTPEAVASAFRRYDAARAALALEEVVPGHTTLLLVGRHRRPGAEALATAGLAREAGEPRREVRIPVSYDGPDLAEVAGELGTSVEEVVNRHQAGRYTVAFLGFAPGQAYLVGGDPRLAVARRAEPRTRVPRGTVAIAGEYSTVYTSSTPGGWRLLGTTTMTLFDPASPERPALLAPGDGVVFAPGGDR